MKINYCFSGKGDETVLFLHGWGANLYSFFFYAEQLKHNYKTLCVDFPGFGESEKLAYPLTVFDYAMEIFRLLKILNIKKISIVCHSFGARVAVLLASKFDLKINKLIIIGGAGLRPKFNLCNKLKVLTYKLAKCINKFKLCNFNLEKFGSSDYKHLNNIEKQTFVNVINFNERKYLSLILTKTLLMWGEKDDATPTYMAHIFNKCVANSKLKVFKGLGHFCFLENKSAVLFEINYFLEN
jgi:pimeloyl-ACP methyl ester carboxylesterase